MRQALVPRMEGTQAGCVLAQPQAQREQHACHAAGGKVRRRGHAQGALVRVHTDVRVHMPVVLNEGYWMEVSNEIY